MGSGRVIAFVFTAFLAGYTILSVAGVPIGPGESTKAEIKQKSTGANTLVRTISGMGYYCPEGWLVYTLAEGDNLEKIASRFTKPGESATIGDKADLLALVNRIPDKNLVYAGQDICVPSGNYK